ncbi:uncharacterized protein PHALS_00517 [Plasmopara halstedii]|uniref:Uncharacterized protein n=1 Tax=Plasmopara halstedii TaxID=4781 RepID=A0A0N7L3L3_PLAHL|nr:uncharacterized protein PHALS_00517 [Plasmopara halstedii]CEG36195.1 hypothetical protein PHALS_00517 [Plasmopara halstedii]|eukprot:XP_024572564.1 hypothetical protein PHALS_00517 [Plasmopara halstedii]
MVSVATCGNLAITSTPRNTASLLFTLQMYIDCVTLHPVPSPISVPLLLAFQLLQYEIVLFDDTLSCNEALDGLHEPAVTKLQYGKSCLFEASPNELVRELQQDVEAPLTLLILAKEHGRGRLRAFAAVPLALKADLLDDDTSSNDNLLHICEWASHSGLWELRDHSSLSVGSVTGTITLSCLGNTLAPHLRHALGVQVDKFKTPTTRRVVQENITMQSTNSVNEKTGESQAKQVGVTNLRQVKKENGDTRVLKQDLSVQCDQDMLDKFVVTSELQNKGSKRHDSHSLSADSERAKITNFCCDDRFVHLRKTSMQKVAQHQPSIDHRRIRDAKLTKMSVDAVKVGLLFPREPPPPLFFEKKSSVSRSSSL